MLKKIKIFSLILLATMLGSQVSAQMNQAKKVTLGLGAVISAGYAAIKMITHYPYFELNSVFDRNTQKLLDQIKNKYQPMLDLLEDYEDKTSQEQAEVEQAFSSILLANKILLHEYKCEEVCEFVGWVAPAYMAELHKIQAELELRFNRLNSWTSNEYLYDKWYDQLLAVKVPLDELATFLTETKFII